MLKQFIKDESGQDLIEYGLLVALIAIIGMATWTQIANQIGLFYAGSDGAVQNLSSCTPDPGGGTVGC